jgi:PAS domain S-box-containing protein
MNSLLKKLLDPRQIEYLFTDENFTILETSFAAPRFAENIEDVRLGADVRDAFPELVGYEDMILSIYAGEQNNFELKEIFRNSSYKNPFYFDLYIIENKEENSEKKQLMMLLEDVTEVMVMKQELLQSANEANLLLSALAASKDYIDKLLESMGDALLVTQQSGIIKAVNPATVYLLGYAEKELIGKSISQFIGEDELFCKARHHYILAQEIVLKELEFLCQKKQGEEIWVEFSCSAIQTGIKGLYDFVYLGRNITQRKQEELKIRQDLAKEKELRILKSRFFSMLSHEFSNPLNAVSFGLQMLGEESTITSEDDKQAYLELMEIATKNMTALLNDVRFISRAESGKLEFQPLPLNLPKFCFLLVEEIKLSTGVKDAIILSIVGFSEAEYFDHKIELDEKLLRHILINLLVNAVKYSPEGGTISLTCFYENETIIFEVKDQGIGIAPEDQAQLFESFYRARNVGSIPGTGLGLSIVKQCVEIHGGSIHLESAIGVGTTFIVKIPIQENTTFVKMV